MGNPETFKETEQEGGLFIIEYVTLCCLARVNRPPSEFLPVTIDSLQKIREKVNPIFTLASVREGLLSQMRTGDDLKEQALGNVAFRVRLEELMVRGPVYARHLREHLTSLFSPVQDWMKSKLGWSVPDALAVELAMLELAGDAAREMMTKAHDTVAISQQHLAQQQTKARKQRQPNTSVLLNTARYASFAWAINCFAPSMWLSVEDISRKAGLDQQVVRSVVAYFCVTFDSGEEIGFSAIPIHQHLLRSRPLVEAESRYLHTAGGAIMWALQKRLESDLIALEPEKTVWNLYEKQRREYLEREAVELLATTLDANQSYTGLVYYPIEEGKKVKAELDGLIVFDQTIFLVEAKAGGLHERARRGEIGRLKGDVKKSVAGAQSQAIRAARYLQGQEEPSFLLGANNQIQIDMRKIKRIVPVAVTLDSMDPVNATVHELVTSGFLKEDDIPWVVSLDILRVIADVNEFPSQLLHYIISRRTMNSMKNLYAHDELDWFAFYLSTGLHFDGSEELKAAHSAYLTSQTGVFDDYYAFKDGLRRTPAEPPRQPLPTLLREVLLELGNYKDCLGHSEVALELLNWSNNGRENLATAFEASRALTTADGRFHDRTIAEPLRGFTIFSARGENAEEALERLEAYTTLKKYQQRASLWTGVLSIVDFPGLVHSWVLHSEPWEKNEHMERLVTELPDKRILREA